MSTLEFGEALNWKTRPALGEPSPMWQDGIYLGLKGNTGGIITGTSEGAWRTRSAQRKPEETRWHETAATLTKERPHFKKDRGTVEAMDCGEIGIGWARANRPGEIGLAGAHPSELRHPQRAH